MKRPLAPTPHVYTDVRHQRTAEKFLALGIDHGKDLDGILTDKERAAVCTYLGLDGLEPTSMPSMAVTLKISRQAVWYLLHTALKKLQRRRYRSRPE